MSDVWSTRVDLSEIRRRYSFEEIRAPEPATP